MALSRDAVAAAAQRAQSYPAYVYVIAAVVLLLVITVVVVVLIAARRRRAADAARAAAGAPVTEDPSAAIRAAFAATEGRLRDKVPDRRVRDGIPRLLLLGEPGSGKTSLLGATLLNTPLDKSDDPRPGDGAPVHLWTFDKAIVVDPAGSVFLTPKGEEPEPPAGLDALIAGLSRGRPGRPIDGMVLTIPCTDLDPHGPSSDDDRKRKATTLHKQIGDIQRKLGMSVPVYVLVTRCDEALASFQSFGQSFDADRDRQRILGWSRPDPEGPVAAARAQDGPAPDFVGNAMKSLEDRLSDRQVARFLGARGGGNGLGAADGLFLFPTELRGIENALRIYVDEIFVPSVYDELFELRGIYFCGDGGTRLTASPSVIAASGAPVLGAAPSKAASSTRGVLFVRSLFEEKIIPEANLARPSQGVVRRRRRLILALQIAAVVAGLCAGIGLALQFERLHGDASSLQDAIGAVRNAEAMTTENDSQTAVKGMLDAFAGIRTDHMATWFLPLSHVSLHPGGLDARVQEGIKRGYELIILPAFSRELATKAEQLSQPEAPLWQGPSAPLNLESAPEFVQLDRWLIQVGQFDGEVARYNDLAHAAKGNSPAEEERESQRRLVDIADLADYLFKYRAEPSFYSDSRYYRQVLAHGVELAEFRPEETRKKVLVDKLHELFDRLIVAMRWLYKDQIVRGDLNGIESGFRLMQAGVAGGLDRDQLRLLRRMMDKTSTDLHEPLLAWVPGKVPPDNQGLDRLLDAIRISPLFGLDQQASLRDSAQQRLLLLEAEIEDATTELTGPLLKHEDGNLKMTLSDEVAAFKKPLDALLAERFMASGEPEDWPKPDERMSWDVELLKDASAMLKEYDAFEQSGQFKQFRGITSDAAQEVKQAAQDSVTALAQLRLRSRLIDRASRAVRHEGGQLRGAPLAERTRADVENLRLAAPAVREILGAFIRFRWNDDRDKLREIVRVQASRLLKDAYGVLSDKHLYGVRGDSFSWWTSEETPAFEAFGVADGAALAEFVAGERGQANATATEFAQPVLALLDSPEVGSDLLSARWQNAWRGVVEPLAAYEAKKPGNGVSILERFLLTELPTIRLDNCFNRISADPARDFFTEKKQHIINILQKRCSQRSGETIETRYFKLASAFRSQLAGRFPFAKADLTLRIDDAPPEAVRAFLEDTGAFTKVYRGELVRRGVEDKDSTRAESARKVVRFLDQMEKVRAFLGPMWGQTDSAADGAFDVEVEFRANPAHENRGNQIAAWIMDFPEKRLTLGALASERQLAHWRMDDGVRLTLRWAKNSPEIPVARQEDQTSRGNVHDRLVTFESSGTWALLRFIASYRTQVRDSANAVDSTANYVVFTVQTKPDSGGGFVDQVGIDSGRARVFIRLVLAGGDKKKVSAYPEFPETAPYMESRIP